MFPSNNSFNRLCINDKTIISQSEKTGDKYQRLVIWLLQQLALLFCSAWMISGIWQKTGVFKKKLLLIEIINLT